jgi:hypothetical protein
MKKILMLLLMFVAFTTINAQTNSFSSVSLSEITASQDTISGPANYNLGFQVTFSSLATTQSIGITLLDATGNQLTSLGNYVLVSGPNNFYYLNSSQNEKKSVMGNKASFLNVVSTSMYNSANSVKLSATMSDGSVQTFTKTLSK